MRQPDDTDANADGSGDADGPGDGTADDSSDVVPPYDAGVEVAFPPVEEIPGCGNGILESGEECDDRNRLNGDGCDWECRLGDGDAPPPPDPSVPDYVPAGDPATVPVASGIINSQFDLPLLWTGSAYAMTYLVDP